MQRIECECNLLESALDKAGVAIIDGEIVEPPILCRDSRKGREFVANETFYWKKHIEEGNKIVEEIVDKECKMAIDKVAFAECEEDFSEFYQVKDGMSFSTDWNREDVGKLLKEGKIS